MLLSKDFEKPFALFILALKQLEKLYLRKFFVLKLSYIFELVATIMTTLYERYKTTKEWIVIEKAIKELIQNRDIQPTTSIEYIVGYIAKQLIENKNYNKNSSIDAH